MPKTRKTVDVPTPIATASRRVKTLIRTHLREKSRGGKAYEKSRESITKALQCGLKPGQAVEIEVNDEQGGKTKKLFSVKDNFVGEVAFKKAYVSRYEIVEIPRTTRVPNPEAVIQTEVVS